MHNEILTPNERHEKAAELLREAAALRCVRKRMKDLEKEAKKMAYKYLEIEVFRLS